MILESPKIAEAGEQLGIDQLIDQYKNSEDFVLRAKSPNSKLAYVGDLTQFLRFCQIHQMSSISQLRVKHLTIWGSEMRTQRKTEATIARKIAALGGFLKWTIAERLLPPDFDKNLPYPRIHEQPREILTPKQIKALIAETKKGSLRDAALVQIALKTGARAQEIVSLKTEDVLIDLATGQVSLKFGDQEKGKGRAILLDEEAATIVKKYIEEKKPAPRQHIFTHARNKHPLTRQGLWLIFKSYGKNIRVLNLTAQVLRNTFTAKLIGDPKKCADLLGVSEPHMYKIQRSVEGGRGKILNQNSKLLPDSINSLA